MFSKCIFQNSLLSPLREGYGLSFDEQNSFLNVLMKLTLICHCLIVSTICMYTKRNYVLHIKIMCCYQASRQNAANFKFCEMLLRAKFPMEILKNWQVWQKLTRAFSSKELRPLSLNTVIYLTSYASLFTNIYDIFK